jgi:hypothetical protein
MSQNNRGAIPRLAEWASRATVPVDVAARVRLHALSVAAQVRVPPTGPESAARSTSNLLDFAPHGPVGAAMLVAALYRDRTAGERLRAVAIAEEVAAKIGTRALLTTEPADARAWVTAIAVATARGLLSDLSPDRLADAIALALARPNGATADAPDPMALDLDRIDSNAREQAFSAAFQHGWTAIDRVRRDEGGDLTLLDQPDTIPGVSAITTFQRPLDALDHWWLRRMVVRHDPVYSWLVTPVQAFAEVLRRHLKAASKRLRVDQIERVEVRLDGRAWQALQQASGTAGGPGDLVGLLASLVATHEPLAAMHTGTPEAEAARAALAGRVTVRADAGLTVAATRGWLHANGALWRELSISQRLAALQRMRPTIALDTPDAEDARGLWNLGTGDLVERLLDPPDTIGDHLPRPTSIRLYTSRGGWWPERRTVVEGGPESSWSDQRQLAIRAYASARRGADAESRATAFVDRGELEVIWT